MNLNARCPPHQAVRFRSEGCHADGRHLAGGLPAVLISSPGRAAAAGRGRGRGDPAEPAALDGGRANRGRRPGQARRRKV